MFNIIFQINFHCFIWIRLRNAMAKQPTIKLLKPKVISIGKNVNVARAKELSGLRGRFAKN